MDNLPCPREQSVAVTRRGNRWEPDVRVSGGLEASRNKVVLGFDGIKVHRMTGGLMSYISPV